MTLNNKKLIDLKQAASLSGYNPDYISFLIRSGKLKGQRIGRSWFTTAKDLKHHQKSVQGQGLGPLKVSFAIFILITGAIVFGFWISTMTNTGNVSASTEYSSSSSTDQVSSSNSDALYGNINADQPK